MCLTRAIADAERRASWDVRAVQGVGAKHVCLAPLHGSTVTAADYPNKYDERENFGVRNVVERESHRPDDRQWMLVAQGQWKDGASPRNNFREREMTFMWR